MSKHSKLLGVDLDPNDDMVLNKKPDGDCDVTYKGQNMDYNTYVDELEERANRKQQGKTLVKDSIGLFGGVNFDKNGNIIKSSFEGRK
jgi:hypothetical protein